MIYCVIPRELADELYDKMVDYYKDNPNVTVIVDRRDGPDRARRGKPEPEFIEKRETRDRRRARIPGTFPDTDAPTSDQYPRLRGDGDLREHEPGDRRGARHRSRPRAPTTSTRPSRRRSAAFEEWRLVPAPRRGEILYRFAQVLEREKAALTDLMTREMGKVKAEAGGDVQEAIDMTYYMAGEGRRLWGQTTPSELPDKFNMSVRVPVGVVGAITPWNFPIAIPSWKLAPALVCGNTVVLKPAEDTPLLAERFVELLDEAGLPDGVVNIVHGYGETAGDALVRHPDVPVITFTGSRETGVAVTKAAADRLKHVHLELGGKNAIIVLDDADLDLAVEGIVWSAFGTSGQRCTAASRVIAHEAVYDALQSRLVERAEGMRLGPGLGGRHRHRPGDQPRRDREDPLVHEDRPGRGRAPAHRRRDRDRGRPRQGLLLPADDLRRRRRGHAHRAGGDLRPDDRAHQGAATSTRRSASRTASGTASRRRSSRAT